jgi:hypothetical protein
VLRGNFMLDWDPAWLLSHTPAGLSVAGGT